MSGEKGPSNLAQDRVELWQGIYKTIASSIHLMVLSSDTQDEARRRIGVIRLELAVAEGGLAFLDKRHAVTPPAYPADLGTAVTVHEDADASEGTCLAEVESLPPNDTPEKGEGGT